MEVLFNYKRTIEDLEKCESKASVRYNFPFVSDCVGSDEFRGPCKGSQYPVPCGDGTCHSNYISCLRSMAQHQRIKESTREIAETRLRLASLVQDRLGGKEATTAALLNTIYEDAKDKLPSSKSSSGQGLATLQGALRDAQDQSSPVSKKKENNERNRYRTLVFSGELEHHQ